MPADNPEDDPLKQPGNTAPVTDTALTEAAQTAAATTDSFKPDYKIAYLSLFGLIGFVVGCLTLFSGDLTKPGIQSIFHEIVYKPQALAAALINPVADSLKKEMDSLGKSSTAMRALPDSIKKKDPSFQAKADTITEKIKADTAIYLKLLSFKKYYASSTKADTSDFKALNSVLHFDITPELLDQWEKTFNDSAHTWKDGYATTPVDYYTRSADIPWSPFSYKSSTVFKLHKYYSDIDFMTKYPAAGTWVLLTLVLCSFCAIAIATAINYHTRISSVFTDENITASKTSGYYFLCIVITLVLLFVQLLWHSSFYDVEVIKNIYFMAGLNHSLYLVVCLGNIAGAFCLAGFIYTASRLGYFATKRVETNKAVAVQRVKTDKANNIVAQDENAPPVITPEQVTLDEKIAEKEKQELIYAKLSGIFQSYFTLAAIILSLIVFCTGALYSTVNSLDFVKLLADDWGYNPTGGDFVYLYGALYTVILLLVYIPAKIKFNESAILPKDTGTAAASGDGGKWYDLLKDPFGQLKGIMVAASPLLASFLGALFQLLFK